METAGTGDPPPKLASALVRLQPSDALVICKPDRGPVDEGAAGGAGTSCMAAASACTS